MSEAILWRKQKKAEEIRLAELRKREEENRKFFVETKWSFEQTKGFMLYRAQNLFEGKSFILDEKNEAIFTLLCLYFSDDKEFISMSLNMGIENPSLDKGIVLAGNFGVGKTWLMKLFAKNQRQVFQVYNAKYIADLFEKDGEEAIETFAMKQKNAFNDPSVFYQSYCGLCIDDIGTEDIKNHYGNKKNVIGDIIEKRYDKNYTGVFLHGTTNLTGKQLNEFYGGRVHSRLCEIVNFIELPGNDRRE